MSEQKGWQRVQKNPYPCKKDCPDRKPACHDSCKRYIDAKAADLKNKAAIRAKKIAEHEVKGYVVQRISEATGKPIKSR